MTTVRIKELSVRADGGLTFEGVEIDVSEQTLTGLIAAFGKKALAASETLKTTKEVPSKASTLTISNPKKTAPKVSSSDASCPECAAAIVLAADTVASEIMSCTDCGAELEVVSLDPPVIVVAPEEEEDWGE